MHRGIFIWSAAVSAILLAAVATPLWADPSIPQPHSAPAIHGAELVQTLHATAQSLYDKEMVATPEFFQQAAQNKLSARRMNAAGESHVNLKQLERMALRLQHAGEPAGIDYQLRYGLLKKQMDQVIAAYQVMPAAAAQIDKIRLAAERGTPAREKKLKAFEKLAEQEKWAEAETEMLTYLDGLKVDYVFLAPGVQELIFAPFDPLLRTVQQKMETARRVAANADLIKRRDAQLPNYEALQQELEQAPRAIAQNGTVTVGDQALDGPAYLQRIGQLYKQAHVQALRYRALEWARTSVIQKVETPELLGIYAAHDKLDRAVAAGCAAVIEADATRGRSEAVQRYKAYLQVLAPLQLRRDDRRLADAVEPALAKLAASDPSFQINVANYQLATDGIVHWRRSVARRQAAAKRSEAPPLPTPFPTSMRSTPQLRGLFPLDNRVQAYPEYVGCAAEILKLAETQVLNKRVSLPTVLAMGNTAAGRFDRRTWTLVNAGALSTAIRQASQTAAVELLVDADNPPLSLAAQQTLLWVQSGELAEAGGTVNGVTLEALITRFATLPDSGWPLVPLGPLPGAGHYSPEKTSWTWQQPLRQAVLRCQVEAAWGHNDYLFVELASR